MVCKIVFCSEFPDIPAKPREKREGEEGEEEHWQLQSVMRVKQTQQVEEMTLLKPSKIQTSKSSLSQVFFMKALLINLEKMYRKAHHVS